jgi:hypothetical protein
MLPGGQLDSSNAVQIAQFRQQVAAEAGTHAITDLFSMLIWAALVMVLISLALPGRSDKGTRKFGVQ